MALKVLLLAGALFALLLLVAGIVGACAILASRKALN
jgi:hypothetical protein